jgi:RNA polymerase sigma-70 factor (ECF subfamily)
MSAIASRAGSELGWALEFEAVVLRRRETAIEGELGRALVEKGRRLRSIARRAGGQEDEDIVQDAFLRVVERSRREEIPKLDNFLAHVVRCLAIDRLRRRATRATATSGDLEEGAVDAVADPERGLMGAQRLKRVMAAIDAMPPRRREVFLLHRIEELTYAQIARRIGVSIKAVEKHIHLAMRQLSDADD